MKRSIALLLCLLMILFAFAGCSSEDAEEKEKDLGAYVYMYLTDPVYNFDPDHAYGNEAALKVVSLLYDNLFILNENGKVEKSLVESYKINKKENSMLITLRDDTFWSDGTAVSANDVVFSWQRILDSSKSFDAAVLLYDVKNARACKEGDVPSIDDVGIQALNKTDIQIEFETGIDYDNFIRNLTSYALAPLRSDIVNRTTKEIDWAKSATTVVASGPFRLRNVSHDPATAGITLERNAYFRRDFMNDPIDKSVTPYRLIIDYTQKDEDILSNYESGKLFYIGDLPLSIRSKYSYEEWEKKADITNGMSTHSYLFNENAVVRYYNANGFKELSGTGCVYNDALVAGTDGDKLFANKDVRTALSLAIDRTTIAKKIVFAEAANGLVPNGVFNGTDRNKTFRDNDSTGLALTANIDAAKKLLAAANIVPSNYMFAISVPAYDDVHMEIAKMVQAAWGKDGVGFNVAINAIENIDNQDTAISTGAVISGIKDDIFSESFLEGKFEVAAIDYTAYSTDAFACLAVFAKGYTGGASVSGNSIDFTVATHKTGFNNETYNAKIEAAFKEKDIDKRAALLHEAEDILMKELPIVPVIFNQNVVMQSKKLKNVDFDYYGSPIFTEAKLKNYKDYIPAEETK